MKNAILTYLFVSAMTSKNITAENINVFKNLNINQLGLTKDDF